MHSFIEAPEASYFLHGFRTWNQYSSFQVFEPEMSCSLQLDDHTNPFRPFGVIIAIEEGGLVQGFDQDVSSVLVEGVKVFGQYTNANALTHYEAGDLSTLLQNTRKYRHNELWVKAESVHVIGAYCIKNTHGITGAKAFRKECMQRGLELRVVPRAA